MSVVGGHQDAADLVSTKHTGAGVALAGRNRHPEPARVGNSPYERADTRGHLWRAAKPPLDEASISAVGEGGGGKLTVNFKGRDIVGIVSAEESGG